MKYKSKEDFTRKKMFAEMSKEDVIEYSKNSSNAAGWVILVLWIAMWVFLLIGLNVGMDIGEMQTDTKQTTMLAKAECTSINSHYIGYDVYKDGIQIHCSNKDINFYLEK